MTDHGAVQTVFSHHTAAAPALLTLPPFGPAVLEPHLDKTHRVKNIHTPYLKKINKSHALHLHDSGNEVSFLDT